MNPLIEKFGKQSRWVIWKYKERDGKKTKVPFSIAGDMASSTDPDTWSTYDEVKNFSDNVGIVFTPDQTLLGIDIDHCLNLKTKEIEHEQKEAIEKLIKESNTYCEISPSGTGLHLFLSLDDGLQLTANRHGSFEAYTSGRYFTFTGEYYRTPLSIRTVSSPTALGILGLLGYPWKKEEKLNEKSQEELPLSTEKKPIVNLNDSEILQKMFASKTGSKIRGVYEKVDGKSEDDLSLCSSLAFWTGKDALQIERIWLTSPLGSRKKTQDRKNYRDRTIATAIASCKEIYEISPSKKSKNIAEKFDLDFLFTYDSQGKKMYIQNTENICRILRRHPDFQGRFRYDEFKNILEILEKNKWRNIEDNDAVIIQTKIQILFSYFGKVGKDMVYDAVIAIAKENKIDSACDYILSLRWDGIARLNSWLKNTYGVPEDMYHEAVASNWIKGLVKRIIEPGCKFDYVLVLEGPQGSKKSTSLYVLGGDWHVETTMSTDSKDFFMQFQGKAIVEFSEGETLNRTEVKKMKAIITTQSDKYRPPYERSSRDFPRRCVFAMTTNQTEYLKDETGNRRWLPVTVVLEEANVEWLLANRDQIFAEAYHRVFNLKETIYEFPKEATLLAQEERRIRDPNADLVVDWYYNKLTQADRDEGITVHQIYRDVLNNGFTPARSLDRYTEMLLGDILKNSMKLRKERVMINKVRSNRWFEKDTKIKTNIELSNQVKMKDDEEF